MEYYVALFENVFIPLIWNRVYNHDYLIAVTTLAINAHYDRVGAPSLFPYMAFTVNTLDPVGYIWITTLAAHKDIFEFLTEADYKDRLARYITGADVMRHFRYAKGAVSESVQDTLMQEWDSVENIGANIDVTASEVAVSTDSVDDVVFVDLTADGDDGVGVLTNYQRSRVSI